MESGGGYRCQNCNKTYREKFNYDRHFLCCDFFHKSCRERKNEIDIENDHLPDPRQMYSLIQDMVLRIDKLEKENKKYRNMQKNKINIIDWLNAKTSKPPILFSKWIAETVFPNIKENLETVFTTDLMTGILKSFDKAIEMTKESDLPICTFDIKNLTFYVFDNQPGQEIPSWFKISNTDFENYLAKIDHQFLVDFNKNWYVINKDKMETDESFKDKYICYHKSILGGDRMSDQTRYNKIRHKLYEKLKKTINPITIE
jgi:hypothetical protein